MGNDDLTEKQEAILRTKKKNPEMSREEIAVETDSSASYVSQVLNEYDESDLDSGGIPLWVILLVLLGLALLALSEGDGSSAESSLLMVAAFVPDSAPLADLN